MYKSIFISFLSAALLTSGCVMVPTFPAGIGNVAPGNVDPNGRVNGRPGQTYFNKSNSTFWEKASGRNTDEGWVQLF